MDIIRDYQFVAPHLRGASAAIGNFDGIHLGHQHVLDRARHPEYPLGVVTFEPHPRQFFSPNAPAFRLMSSAARANRLAKLGVERLYELNFNTSLSELSPDVFVKDVLFEGLGLRNVVVGSDFCFGKNRAGNAETLRHLGASLGFGVTAVPLLQDQGKPVSSTAIRRALSDGLPEQAAAMLGHWHRLEGPVVHGEKRGRTLGYPTANMELTGLHVPRLGVYAVLVDVLSGPHKGSYDGVASLGVRPMFGGETPNLESYLFDFTGDIYGTPISVALVAYLRPEESFPNLDALIAQMDRDSAAAREWLKTV